MNPTKVKVVVGNNSLAIKKGMVATILSVKELGPEYSHKVSVVLRFPGPRVLSLLAQHKNRVQEKTFHLNNGDPTKRITVMSVPDNTPIPGTVKVVK